MKTNFAFNYSVRHLVGALFVALAGCATQSPVATAPIELQNYDQMFETAVKAMNKMGSVQFSNRDRGTISGFTPSGVTISEPDRYLDIYRQLSQR
jgi:hypothetical protein